MFEIAIKELSNLKENKYLKLDKIEFWLLKYGTLYSQTIKNYSCSNFELPCMCSNRKKDCLFIDVFKALEKISEMYFKDKFYTAEISKYNDIKENLDEVRKWLTKNLHEKDIDLPYSPEYEVYYDKEISLCNGKEEGEYNYYILKIKGQDFKNSYDFINIYNHLFFTKRVLLTEYEKWKLETGYIDFDD